MAVEVEIDVELLKSEIKKTYACVADEPGRDFIFQTGRAWAEELCYPAELANVPDAAVESFAGIANPWGLGRLAPGERMLDLGSGTGTDSPVAAQMVGAQGYVTGIDMTPEMLAKARVAAAAIATAHVSAVRVVSRSSSSDAEVALTAAEEGSLSPARPATTSPSRSR